MPARIAICMATHNPDPALFAAQIGSIREQDHEDWICLISDDASTDEGLAVIREEIGDDERFTLSPSTERLGFYRNFERALAMVPEDIELVALSDQDDRWYPEKLTVLLGALGDAALVYSDQRIVTEDGTVIADSYWGNRRNNHTNLTSLLIANTVTGAASLFRAAVVRDALPFPELPGEPYHDHWLALVAMVTGGVNYVDRPLYDYVQHGSAVLGHDAANAGNASRGAARLNPRHWREIYGGWGSCYFDVHLRLKALAELLISRCGDRVSKRDRRALERYINADRTLAGPLWMAIRPYRRLFGRNETLGVERILARAFLYRDVQALRSKAGRKLGGGAARGVSAVLSQPDGMSEVNRMKQKVQPLGLSVNGAAPERVNLLIPTFDLDHLFGGYIAKFNLARRLSEAGHRVRIVTVDPTPPLEDGWRDQVERFDGLAGLFDRVELSFGREQGLLEVNPADRFIATTWWSALIAADAVRHTEAERFVYMIQEYEPLTVPQGSWAALAASSYSAPHQALFSTGLLAEYFEAEGIGVFAEGVEAGRAGSNHFQNAITAVTPPSAAEIDGRESRKLLFYARPEPHAARNLFELGLLSLRRAVEDGRFGDGWEFFGIGSIGRHRAVTLGDGRELTLLPRTGQSDYSRMLGEHDLGLALMYAPHPSLVPVEMASAGLVTVTNSYATKTAERLESVSSNLVVTEPAIEAIAEGLGRAVALSEDTGARIRGARIDWPSDWDSALDDATIERLGEQLGRC